MPVSARVRRVERAVLFIESRLFDELDVSHIAQAAGGSVSELHRLFRRVHGMPLMAYVRARRLTEATRMLDTADVLEVARRCGYESQATFTRAFTRRFGVPPGRFRRQGAAPYRRVEGATQASLAHRDALQAPDGTILAVNAAWRDFTVAAGGAADDAPLGLGSSYLGVCAAAGDLEPGAGRAAALSRSVFSSWRVMIAPLGKRLNTSSKARSGIRTSSTWGGRGLGSWAEAQSAAPRSGSRSLWTRFMA